MSKSRIVAAVEAYQRAAIALGELDGVSGENKFGRAPDGVQTTPTDIWDRADAATTQQIWVAPTQARPFTMESDSADDDVAGVGAKTVEVFGLRDWDTAEFSEVVPLDGMTPVALANEYVTIHRMNVLTCGGTSINVGTIKVTAGTDGSITAAILPGIGNTRMAIYSWPSTQTALLGSYYAGLNASAGPATSANVTLEYNSQPDVHELDACFREVHTLPITKDGTSYFRHPFDPPKPLPGPGILKVQCVGSVVNLDVSAGADLVTVDN